MTITGTNSDIAVISTDSNGDTIWTKTYFESGVTIANSIASTYDGGYIIAAISIVGGPTSSSIIKINSNGDSLWSTKIIDSAQFLYCRSIVQTEDGGYVVAGYNQSPNSGLDVFLCKLGEVTDIDEEITSLPENVALHQNYPNPFNASTIISFKLKEPEYVNLSVYDLLGRKVGTLTNGYLTSGNHNVVWGAEEYNSGVYFYKLLAGNYSDTKRMILIK